MNRCVVFAANRGYALKSSREGIIQHFLEQGWKVVLATADDVDSQALTQLGAVLEPVRFSRGGLSPSVDYAAWQRMKLIAHHYQPALIHHFHAKPLMFGSMAARKVLGNKVRIVNTITGLGHAFVQGGWISCLAGWGYRRALPHADLTIFQNPDDRDLFLDRRWVAEPAARLIVGSGVNIERFTPRLGHNTKAPVVVMLGRLIWQKGVAEFTEVARRVRARYHEARFLWAGDLDEVHPDAVPAEWVAAQGAFEYLGQVSDVPDLFQNADLLLFPSYREGVPRTVMEAAACAVPSVAFDVPGVREAVRNGETGILVPDRDVNALSDAVVHLLDRQGLREKMGKAGRQLAESAFDIRAIQAAHFAVYRELGIDITAAGAWDVV